MEEIEEVRLILMMVIVQNVYITKCDYSIEDTLKLDFISPEKEEESNK